MRNVYQVQVRAQCPVNPTDTDLYSFTIMSEEIIKVEGIVEFFRKHAGDREVFQEDLTRKAAVALGARVISVGWHSGVKVTSSAP